MSDAEFLRKVLAKRFLGCGSETANTKLFAKFADEFRARLVDLLPLQTEELPVLLSMHGKDKGVLITTRRILDFCRDKYTSIEVKDIEQVLIEPLWKLLEPRDLGEVSTSAGEQMKMTATKIKLVLSEDDPYYLELEAGQSYFGVANVLMYFQDANAVKRKIKQRSEELK